MVKSHKFYTICSFAAPCNLPSLLACCRARDNTVVQEAQGGVEEELASYKGVVGAHLRG